MPRLLKDISKINQEDFETKKSPFSPKENFTPLWKRDSLLKQSPTLSIQQELENELDNKIGDDSENKTESNKGTLRERFGDIREHLGNDSEDIQITKSITFSEQQEIKLDNVLENKSGNDLIKLELMRLTGIQQKLFLYVLDLSLLHEQGTTGFILTQMMAKTIDCGYDSAKISLKRLITKGLIIRHKGKTSRGGFIILAVPKEVKILALQLKLGSKSDNKLENKSETAENHYNSSNKNTTIGEGWDEIDTSFLHDAGFTKNHLLQLKNCNKPEIVQESIKHFAFALKYNDRVKAYDEPIKVFMATMRRGEAWVEAKYISPQEQAIRAYREAKKAEEGRAQEEYAKLFDEEFKSWNESLKEDEKVKITAQRIPSFQTEGLRTHFKENIWPAIWAEIKK